MPGIYISAAHKSSGKTTVTIGLCAALRLRGINVRAYKKGPDYIDPEWLKKASGKACYNLDFYTSTEEEILNLYGSKTKGCDLTIVEGNKGLFDGMDVKGSDSNAALAKLLDIPVILVIDTMGMTRGIAPLLIGYQQFDKEIKFGGVILNRVAGPRHQSKLIESVEYYTDLPVLGAVPRFREGEIAERHLGLIPATEDRDADRTIEKLAHTMEEHLDLDRISRIGEMDQRNPLWTGRAGTKKSGLGVRVGVARDEAFGFYYADDLEKFEALGAEIIWVDLVSDSQLPPLDGLFIGGGFPETSLRELEANRSMRESVRSAIESGLPCYAECGGLMYLSRSIAWRGREARMVGVIPGDITMSERPHGRGYIQLKETEAMPWSGRRATVITGHEFHYSQLEGLPEDMAFAYEVIRGAGIRDHKDGIVYKNLLASYAHLRDSAQNHWVERFVQFMAQYKNR